MSRRRVASPRNSVCGSACLAALDWSNWFTDTGFGTMYLHVQSLDAETWHRVYCRKTDTPRLRLMDGVLYWLIDEEVGKCQSA